jgi:hypothetical protein
MSVKAMADRLFRTLVDVSWWDGSLTVGSAAWVGAATSSVAPGWDRAATGAGDGLAGVGVGEGTGP